MELSFLASRLLASSKNPAENSVGESNSFAKTESPMCLENESLAKAVQTAFELWTASHQFLEAYKSTRANGAGAFCQIPASIEYVDRSLPAYWRSDAGQRGLLIGIDHHYRSLDEFAKFDIARIGEEVRGELRQRFGDTAALKALSELGFGNGNEWERADRDLKGYLEWLPSALRDLFRRGLESPKFRAKNAPFVNWEDAPHFVRIVEGQESLWKLSVFRGEPEKGWGPEKDEREEILEIRV